MAWVELNPSLLRTHLAVAEQNALATVQVSFDVDSILADECTNIANAWRSKIRLFHSIDKRENYVPESVLEYILVHVRYSAYTRLPSMGELLDELRRREWDRANQIFDDIRKMYIDEVEPEEEEVNKSNTPVVIVDNQSWRFDEYI